MRNLNSDEYVLNAETRRKLFGHEDASREDAERLKDYYIVRKDCETVSSSLSFCIVLGRKGTGKSATLKYCFTQDSSFLPVWVRPDDITELYREINTELHISDMILLWKKAIARFVACRISEKINFTCNDDNSQILEWAYNAGYKSKDFISQVAHKFSIRFSTGNSEISTNDAVSPSIGEHHVLSRALSATVRFYMDDLDRGWSPTPTNGNRLKALIIALGDLTTDIENFKARISLRTDVYDYISSDGEFFDKYETSLVWCKWQNADIFKVLIKRLATFRNVDISDEEIEHKAQKELALELFPPILATKFEDTTAWQGKMTHKVLLSLIRGVPRDLVKLLHAAAEIAYSENQTTINGKHICKVGDIYSNARLNDICREFDSELTNIKRFLLNLGPTIREIREKRDSRYLYKTGELIEKIKSSLERVGKSSVHFTYTITPSSPMELAHFIYKIGFITARKDNHEKEKIRTTFDRSPYLLTSSHGDRGFSWEIHPAYRAALYANESSESSWEQTVNVSDDDETAFIDEVD